MSTLQVGHRGKPRVSRPDWQSMLIILAKIKKSQSLLTLTNQPVHSILLNEEFYLKIPPSRMMIANTTK
jgi:hypothetical protein